MQDLRALRSKAVVVIITALLLAASWESAQGAEVSEQTAECLGCHETFNPEIVSAWKQSRHGRVTPAVALQKPAVERRVSSTQVPDALKDHPVGCFECHSLNAAKHKDSFEHNGHTLQVVVSPADCSTCHSQERLQYDENLMSHAYGNLVKNPLYQDLVRTINGHASRAAGRLSIAPPDQKTNEDSCLYCHGTAVEVKGKATRETQYGEMEFPLLEGWPNQGVGRVNPDGSIGACTPCHTRHRFSIETARKPHTCSECHVGPDVPAYKVYEASKHGNLYSTYKEEWDFEAVPWKAGKDFAAPTCATCHASLLVDGSGEVVAERTHAFTPRLPWRIFGLIYAHPHPKSADVSTIVNKAGIPLPTELSGEPVSAALIDRTEQDKRTAEMQKSCRMCHSTGWVEGHWQRFEHAIASTNASTLTATQLMAEIWEKGIAQGLPQKASIFDEAVERKWSTIFLYYGNTIRFASAMAGGGDYGVFANGRYMMSREIMDLKDWLDTATRSAPPAPAKNESPAGKESR
jgi:hydroxylamine dehydrogenase